MTQLLYILLVITTPATAAGAGVARIPEVLNLPGAVSDAGGHARNNADGRDDRDALSVADTGRYTVINHGRRAGGMIVVRSAGAVLVQYHHVDRNRGRWVQNRYRLDDGEALQWFEARQLSRALEPGDVTAVVEVDGDSVHQTMGERRISRALPAGGIVLATNATAFEDARLARALLRVPAATARLHLGITARARVVADTVVHTSRGPERVRFVHVHGPGSAGTAVWLDERDELFASEVGWFITVREGADVALPVLRRIELGFREAQAAELAQRLMQPLAGTLVIRNGDLFDSETGSVLPQRTVVVRGDRIVEVGPAASVRVPSDALVIDATGKTIMPGMWEMHGHLLHTGQVGASIQQLAHGITTVRDLAADTDVAVSQRDRANAHEIVAPRLILGGFIEGPGAWAGPTDVIVSSEAEAREWVARYDSLGYRQIKLYNLVHPDLVPAFAEETRRRGMILSGHVPRGLSVPAAVRLGLDEINHAAFLFSTFFPDSLFIPEMRPYSAVAAAVAATFPVDGPEMTALIEVLRAHGTVVDGTFNLWMGGRAQLTGQGDATSAAYLRLIRRLHDAGVTLVPGTDNISSSTYLTELELYEHAGIPASAVLQLATLVPARVMGEATDYGSVAAGKVADILIVDGRPYERIADLGRVEHVIRAGRVYRPSELRQGLAAAAAVTTDEAGRQE